MTRDPTPLTAQKVMEALKVALTSRAPEIDYERWRRTWGYRTHVMLGRAIRGGPERGTDVHVLGEAMRLLDYAPHSRRGTLQQKRIYAKEWYRLDLVAAEAETNWHADCWRGRYRLTLTLALEVENDIREFELTMRGLLDVRVPLGVGIFYATRDDLDGIEVGVGSKGVPLVRLETWTPPWAREAPWQVRVEPGTTLAVVFLDAKWPRVIGAKTWVAHDG